MRCEKGVSFFVYIQTMRRVFASLLIFIVFAAQAAGTWHGYAHLSDIATDSAQIAHSHSNQATQPDFASESEQTLCQILDHLSGQFHLCSSGVVEFESTSHIAFGVHFSDHLIPYRDYFFATGPPAST